MGNELPFFGSEATERLVKWSEAKEFMGRITRLFLWIKGGKRKMIHLKGLFSARKFVTVQLHAYG